MGKHTFTRKALPLALAAAISLPAVPAMAASNDVSGHWAEKVLTEWQEKGLMKGYSDGTLKPNNSITRAEFITLLNNAKGLTAESSISFTDVTKSDWFYHAVATAAGYTKGYADGSFRPNQTITRAEAAVMLANAAGLTANEAAANGFTDAIPAWAKGSIGAAAAAGLMNGYPDGSFGASANITRAEAVSSLDRMLNHAQQNEQKTEEPETEEPQTENPNEDVSPVKSNKRKHSSSSSSASLKTVAGIAAVIKPIAVDYGMDEATAMGSLPQTVTLNCTDGSTVSAAVTWALDKPYDAAIEAGTTYTATGTVAIPNGYLYNGTLTVETTLTVLPIERVVLGIADTVAPVEVNYATDETTALRKLPQTVSLKVRENKVERTLNTEIAWVLNQAYNATPDSDTAYKAIGTVTIPAGYTYSGTLTTETTVTVLANKDKVIKSIAWPTEGIEVAYGTSEDDAMKSLPSKVALEKYDNSTVFADVTWKRKDGETYNPNSPATVTYIGTTTIPAGYIANAIQTTCETTITVVASGTTAKKKEVSSNDSLISDVNMQAYTAIQAEITAALPTEAHLKCNDGSYIMGTLTPGNWEFDNIDEDTSGKMRHSYRYPCEKVTLPEGYDWAAGSQNGQLLCTVSIPKRDNSSLQAALDAAYTLLDRITDSERDAITDPNKIYKAADGTTQNQVAVGAKFIEENQITQEESALNVLLDGKKDASHFTDQNAENQAWVDDTAAKIVSATAALKNVLDNNSQDGTGYTTAKILLNIKDRLDKISNGAFQSYNQPLTPDNTGTRTYLPYQATGVQIGADENDLANVYLEWSISDTTYADISREAENENWHVNIKQDKIAEVGIPRKVSFTVTAINYDVNNANHPLNEVVATYDCIIGAPISVKTSEINLFSGDQSNVNPYDPKPSTQPDETANVNIALTVSPAEAPSISAIQVEEETASGDKGLFESVRVSRAVINATGDLQLTLNTKTAQLPAVLASDSATLNKGYKTTKLKLTIPGDSIKLSDEATTAGWYVPDELEKELTVRVHNPVVRDINVDSATNEVKVTFEVEYLARGTDIQVALVPNDGDPKDSGNITKTITPDKMEKADGAGNNNKSRSCVATFDVSGVESGTYGVWIKAVGTDAWLNLNQPVTVIGTSNAGGVTGNNKNNQDNE